MVKSSFVVDIVIGIILLVFNKQFVAYFIHLTALGVSAFDKRKPKELFKIYWKNKLVVWSLRILLYLAGIIFTYFGIVIVFF